MIEVIQRGWQNKLSGLFHNVRSELTISSPYISDGGADFLIQAIPSEFKNKGLLRFITNLSSRNIYQGATNPCSFKKLFDNINLVQVFHLPSLHAKVYIQDNREAIITSGNLTAGGLFNNYEYGTYITEKNIVAIIKNDLTDYGNLGALVNLNDIVKYCLLTERVKNIQNTETAKNKGLDTQLSEVLNEVDNKLIALKVADGKIHPIFEKTILYVLKKYGELPQEDINTYLSEIHPDLCNGVNRVINGVNFGKKWKHAVRTSVQTLKKKRLIEKTNEKWKIILTK
ncbi:MAG: phospholipase D-like domain-containing protein [Tannerella sp.]|jgi:hypothetical protein|nr:phospholipase D-like domain-containing protein [Tannerella sp.]